MHMSHQNLIISISIVLLTSLLLYTPSSYSLPNSTGMNLLKSKCRDRMNTAKTGLTCAIKDRELTLTKVKNFPKGSKEAAYTKDIIYNLIHRYILLGGNSIKIIDESTESIKQCKKTYVGFDVVCKEL